MRVLVRWVVVIGVAGMLGIGAPPTPLPVVEAAAEPVNRIVEENRHSGTNRWVIPWSSAHRVADDVNRQIKGYASATSVNIGQSINLHVSMRPAGTFMYDVYRIGWYGGSGGRHLTQGTATSADRGDCPINASTGLRECQWPASATLAIPQSWTSGVYAVVLTHAGTNYQSYLGFTVRDDARQGALVHMQTVLTYQAYSQYPDNGLNGKSLYDYNSKGPNTVAGSPRAVKVSFDRPYPGDGASHLFIDDAPIIYWTESRGYDVKYATNIDLHADPNLLTGQQGLLSAGHDEYWTAEMFTAAENARDSGIGLAFLGGNDVYWQVRLEPSTTGVPNRVVVGYKNAAIDPVTNPARKSVLFRNSWKPEQTLVGVMWPDNSSGMPRQDYHWIVKNSGHWFYRGTGLADGSVIRFAVGNEVDRRLSAYPGPTATEYVLLAQSPFTALNGSSGIHEATMYRAPSGSYVYGAGTLNWMRMIGGITGSEPTAKLVMANVMARFTAAHRSVSGHRRAGSDRYGTAAQLSANTFAPRVPVAYVATGEDFPDALAAAAATGGTGPVLLVRRDEIPQPTRDELVRLQPQRIVLAGSSAVVSDAVLTQLQTLTTGAAVRVGGSSRYATAVELSKDRFQPGVPIVYVATGQNFPDALTAAAAGAQLGGPVLLTPTSQLDPATAAELDRLNPQRIVVVGSSAVVSNAVESEISTYGPTTRRAGQDRYDTALAVARDLVDANGAAAAGLATGLNFPDALAAGPVVAASGGPVLLTRDALEVRIAEELVRLDPEKIIVAGSAAVVPDRVLNAALALFDASSRQGATAEATPVPIPPAAKDPDAPFEERDQREQP